MSASLRGMIPSGLPAATYDWIAAIYGLSFDHYPPAASRGGPPPAAYPPIPYSPHLRSTNRFVSSGISTTGGYPSFQVASMPSRPR
jgi:hypothetical protein